MLTFKQRELVDLFLDKMGRIVSTKTGTYNNADPTCYCKWNGKVWLQHGYGEYWQTDEEGNELIFDGLRVPDEPPPIQVEVYMYDCTWGVEMTFKTDVGETGAYWSREPNPEGGVWVRVQKGFFEVFKDLFCEGSEKNPYEDGFYDWK